METVSLGHGVVLELSKHIPEHVTQQDKNSFFIWGAFDFLETHAITSLSSYKSSSFEKPQAYNNQPVADHQSLYLYKEQTTSTHDQSIKKIDWIFSDSLSIQYPLLIITLVTTDDIIKMENELQKIAPKAECEFELYKTLGPESCVIVFRCKSYEQILQCIVKINSFSQNTYSISGVQAHPSYYKGKKGANLGFKFTKSNGLPEETLATVNYLFRDSTKNNRVLKAVQSLRDTITRFQNNNPGGSKVNLSYELFFELGHYDLTLELRGQLGNILDILLDYDFGLTNVSSKFYDENVIESQTVWKVLYREGDG